MKDFCIVILTIENNQILYKVLNSIDKYYNDIDIYIIDNTKNTELFAYKSTNNNIKYYITKIGYTGVGYAKKYGINLIKNQLKKYKCTFIQDDDCFITKNNTYYILTNLLLKNENWGLLGSIGEKRGWLIDRIKENPKCIIPTHAIGTILAYKTNLLLKIDFCAELKVVEDVDSVLQIIKMGYMTGIVDVGTNHKRHRRLEKEYGDDIWKRNKILLTNRNNEVLKPNSFINKNTPKTLFMKNKFYYLDDFTIIEEKSKLDNYKLL